MSAPTTTPSHIQLARLFTAIPGSNIYVSYPPKTATEQNANANAPSVILIFGWMDAQLPHLLKYTEKYNAIYPSATQILVRTNTTHFLKGESAKRAALVPVAKLLRDAGINENTLPESSGLLVHTFSNGGGMAEATLANAIASTATQQPALPAQAFVYDSLPGSMGLRTMVTAFTAPFHFQPLRAFAQIIFGTFYVLAGIYRHTIARLLGQTENIFEQLHRELNEGRLFPQHVPRTYFYSDADELIPIESVEQHASKAREGIIESGGDEGVIRMVKFEGSSHVSHARKEPERYWEAVVKTWEYSCRL